MENTEKITINLTPTDSISTAIRRQLDGHEGVVMKTATARGRTPGVMTFSRRDLERRLATGQRLRRYALGMAIVDADVDPDLAERPIEQLTVRGALRAPAAVVGRLGERIKT